MQARNRRGLKRGGSAHSAPRSTSQPDTIASCTTPLPSFLPASPATDGPCRNQWEDHTDRWGAARRLAAVGDEGAAAAPTAPSVLEVGSPCSPVPPSCNSISNVGFAVSSPGPEFPASAMMGCGAVLLCEACAMPGHRHAALHADECASLRQLRDDPVVRQRGACSSVGGGPSGAADTSSLRLLLRLIYAAHRERNGTLPPLQLIDESLDVIEDDFDSMDTLEDRSDSFPTDLLDSISDAAARAKYLLSAGAVGTHATHRCVQLQAIFLTGCLCLRTEVIDGRVRGLPVTSFAIKKSMIALSFLRWGACGSRSRMFTNSFALQAYRDPTARTRQLKQEAGWYAQPTTVEFLEHF